MENSEKLLCTDQGILGFEKYAPAEYTFHSISSIGEMCVVISYTKGLNYVGIRKYKTSKSDAIEILEECECVGNAFFCLFKSIYTNLGYTAISLMKLIISDDSLMDLDFEKLYKFEYFVSAYYAYDDYTASESQIKFTKNDTFLGIEKNHCEDYSLEYVPDPPYLFEAYVCMKDGLPTKHYKTVISEDAYNVFEATLMGLKRLCDNICHSIYCSYENKTKRKNK